MFHEHIMRNKCILPELNLHRYPIFNKISLIIRPYSIEPCIFNKSLLFLSRKSIYLA